MYKSSRYGLLFFVMMTIAITWQFAAVPFIVYYTQASDLSIANLVLSALANALIVVSPYWLIPRRWRWTSWLLMALTTAWGISQLWYAPTYNDIMPAQVFTLTGNVNPLLVDAVVGSMRWHDLAIWLPLLVMILLPVRRIKNAFPLWMSDPHDEQSGKWQPKGFLTTLGAALLFFIASNLNLLMGDKTFKENLNERYNTCYVNAQYCGRNGILPYIAYSLHEWAHSYKPLDANERQRLGHFLENEMPRYSNNVLNDSTRKNLIVVIVESLQSWPLNLRIDGREVTPAMNRLMRSDNTITCLNMVSQISYGHSSDGHFIYDTGILPLLQGSVAISFGDRHFPALAKALQGYDKREVMCNNLESWNQTVTPFSYGFEKVYGKNDLAPLLKKHHGIDDNALFDFVNTRLLPHMRQPFMLQMVTITMHTPHTAGKLPETWITRADTLTETGRNYLNEVHNLDQQLVLLLQRLKQLHLDHNTVVAIVSDHNELDLNKVEGRTQATLRDTAIPLIITHAGTTLHYRKVMGQIDLYPTLLDVMGVAQYWWKGFGHSILRYPVTSAVNKRHATLGTPNELTKHQLDAWLMSNLYIRSLTDAKP